MSASSGDAILVAEDVTYRYPTAASGTPPALDHVNLRVRKGEYLALLGHNGSGKSTLARHFNALVLPQEGHVLVDGLDTREAANKRRVRELVGMIFYNPDNQIVATVVEDDVAWALAARGWSRAEIEKRVDEALSMVGLEDQRHVSPHQLSGGQKQRLAIAGVLALRPACILADEVTALLDPVGRNDIQGLLRRLNREQGLTIVQVTHLLEEAALADRIVVLEGGRVALEGTPAEVFSDLNRLQELRLAIPDVIALANRLRVAGLPIPPDALTAEDVASALVDYH
ncbi:MAG TPA: energy-coupling factor transporter ATPase [Ktedonobacterales bacterium]|nr:energy-coupling factor transporter ATPase [Ktedonobacterales bacterium]